MTDDPDAELKAKFSDLELTDYTDGMVLTKHLSYEHTDVRGPCRTCEWSELNMKNTIGSKYWCTNRKCSIGLNGWGWNCWKEAGK